MKPRKVKGLIVTCHNNVFRIHCGDDIDRRYRIQIMREERKMDREVQRCARVSN